MKFSLRAKTIILIIVMAAVLVSAGVIVSGNMINNNTRDYYKNRANDLAHTMATIVDAEDVAALRESVFSIYNSTKDKVTSEEWGTPEFNAYLANYSHIEYTSAFQRLRNQIRRIQDVNDVDCIYLCAVDPSAKTAVYLVDGAYEGACPPGVIDYLPKESLGILDDPARGFQPYLTNTKAYGLLVTAGAPVFDAQGNVICFALVDISMDAILEQERDFILALAYLLTVLTILICVFAILAVNRFLIDPINKLSSAAEHYSHEDQSELENLTIKSNDEIQSLYQSVKQMTRDINTYIGTLTTTKDELNKTRIIADEMDELAHKDALTGVRSKLAYDQMAERLTEEIGKGDAEFGIVMVDLNDLKYLNDNYGHETGNKAIIKVCSIICDVFDHSPVYRVGGDEFVVVLKGRDYENIENLVQEFNAAFDNAGNEPWEEIGAAIGYAMYENGDTVELVFQKADGKMYERKKEMKENTR